MSKPPAERAGAFGDQRDLGPLFHRLNNQLGIVLANAELLERRAADETARARAAQVVASTIEAMATAREIRIALDGSMSSLPPRQHD